MESTSTARWTRQHNLCTEKSFVFLCCTFTWPSPHPPTKSSTLTDPGINRTGTRWGQRHISFHTAYSKKAERQGMGRGASWEKADLPRSITIHYRANGWVSRKDCQRSEKTPRQRSGGVDHKLSNVRDFLNGGGTSALAGRESWTIPLSESFDSSEPLEEAERSAEKQESYKVKYVFIKRGSCSCEIQEKKKQGLDHFQEQTINKSAPPGGSHLMRLLP